jgi:NitT/TauT family transport system substrate-binding protein
MLFSVAAMKSVWAIARSLFVPKFAEAGAARWSMALSDRARRSPALWLGLLFALAAACKTPEKSEPQVTQPAPAAAPAAAPQKPLSAPIQVGYSDWPGFVALEVPAVKGWFKEAGLDVKLVWFEYVPSLEAFQAGKLDAVGITNGDQLVIAASKTPSKMLLLTDYSNGNDMIIARDGIPDMKALKGKKVGVEVGFVDHLLLLNALKAAGMKESDVTLVNIPTDQTPQALKSGNVDAIAAWQPSSGSALAEVAGSKAIHTSAEAPGLIYDGIAVSPDSFVSRRDDWIAFTKVWYRTVDYINDPKNRADVLQIMSSRVGITPERYESFLKGTYLLNAAGNLKHYAPGTDLFSVYFSDQTVNDFNVANKVYAAAIPIESVLDPSLAQAAAK